MPKQNDNNQLALFGAAPVELTVEVDKVFFSAPIKDKDGATVGTRIGIRKPSEIAADLHLKGKAHKDELDRRVREERSNKMRALKSYIAGLDDDYVFAAARSRTMSSGKVRETFVIDRETAKIMATEKEYAEAMGCTVEELRAKLKAIRAASATDVDATVTKPAELPAPPTTETPAPAPATTPAP